LGRYNEAVKNGWKQYCSSLCRSKARTKKITLLCNNPRCQKQFVRIPSHLVPSGKTYCSRSCAVAVNNKKYPKRPAQTKVCPVCQRLYPAKTKFCSPGCREKYRRQEEKENKEKILSKIISFYDKHGRIPVKREFGHYSLIRSLFGTWNEAIEAAGFSPNPLLFAKKFIANDGHICDSLSEKIIDDWLNARNIRHQVNVPYPGKVKLTADFVAKGKYWIEFFGLAGAVAKYDQTLQKKRRLIKKYRLNLIEVYPTDLFPRCRLGGRFSRLESG
jgi:predicted nucleic acid-binding Zn ribbon protein